MICLNLIYCTYSASLFIIFYELNSLTGITVTFAIFTTSTIAKFVRYFLIRIFSYYNYYLPLWEECVA